MPRRKTSPIKLTSVELGRIIGTDDIGLSRLSNRLGPPAQAAFGFGPKGNRPKPRLWELNDALRVCVVARMNEAIRLGPAGRCALFHAIDDSVIESALKGIHHRQTVVLAFVRDEERRQYTVHLWVGHAAATRAVKKFGNTQGHLLPFCDLISGFNDLVSLAISERTHEPGARGRVKAETPPDFGFQLAHGGEDDAPAA